MRRAILRRLGLDRSIHRQSHLATKSGRAIVARRAFNILAGYAILGAVAYGLVMLCILLSTTQAYTTLKGSLVKDLNLNLVIAVGWLAMLGGMLLIMTLYWLTRRGTRMGPIAIRLSDGTLGGLICLIVAPGAILSGFPHYILDANTGAYGFPEDFRNSATFVDVCWGFIIFVAPAFALCGAVVLVTVPLRHWYSNHVSGKDHKA